MTYHISQDQLEAFTEAYNLAVIDKRTYFIFNKKTYITDLAFYVIEYYILLSHVKEHSNDAILSLSEVEEIVTTLADNAPNSRSFILKWWEFKKEELNGTELDT